VCSDRFPASTDGDSVHAREPDELDLEEADVVSVYQKSPDGQCFVVVVNVAVISAVSHEERR